MRNLQDTPRHPGQDAGSAKNRLTWHKKTNPDRPGRRDRRRA